MRILAKNLEDFIISQKEKLELLKKVDEVTPKWLIEEATKNPETIGACQRNASREHSSGVDVYDNYSRYSSRYTANGRS